MAAPNIELVRQRIRELEERIDRQIFPSATDLEELRSLRNELNAIQVQPRRGIEIVIDAWLIDKDTRYYADISTFFYTDMPIGVQDIFGWFESMGLRLQRKAEGLDRIQISGMPRVIPPGVITHTDWQAHLDVILNDLDFRPPSRTGHHKKLTDEERRMRAIERGKQHQRLQQRLDLEFSE
jgi:hypothetical protein